MYGICALIASVAVAAAEPRAVEPFPVPPTPSAARCSLHPTYQGCATCCEIDREILTRFASICGAGVTVISAHVGGPTGGGLGRVLGGIGCEVMFNDSSCMDRCVGKDGDPQPLTCTPLADPQEQGVCRQVCEQGQHDRGPGDCPSGFSYEMRCCVDEFDGCPASSCPGPLCPPWCESEE